jgi:hypothetical protein
MNLGEFTVRYENTECIKEVQSATSKFLFLKCLINNGIDVSHSFIRTILFFAEVNHLEKGISLVSRFTILFFDQFISSDLI